MKTKILLEEDGRYKLLSLAILDFAIKNFVFIFVGIPTLTYFIGNKIMNKEFALGTCLTIIISGMFLLAIFLPIFAALFLLCEMYAEFLACLLFPRKKES